MNKFGGTRGEYGYINSQKKYQCIIILLFVLVATLIFIIGLKISGTRANIFTVVSVLMVLPATKRIIAFIVMLPHKSIDKDTYKKAKEIVEDKGKIICDYIFTSSEKIMSLDMLVIFGKDVYALSLVKKDFEYMKEYLKKNLEKISDECEIKIIVGKETFFEEIEKAAKEEHIFKTEVITEEATEDITEEKQGSEENQNSEEKQGSEENQNSEDNKSNIENNELVIGEKVCKELLVYAV